MAFMSVTLDVSKLIGWLKPFAPWRGSHKQGTRCAGRAAAARAGRRCGRGVHAVVCRGAGCDCRWHGAQGAGSSARQTLSACL